MRRIYITKAHVIMEILSYLLMLACFILAAIGLRRLPPEIATHYDLAGNPDGYGSPMALFLLPCILLFSNLVISAVIHFLNPDFWSLPVQPKKERKVLIYKDVVSMMVWMELEISLFALVYTVMSYRQEMGGAMLLSLLLMAAFTVTIICFLVLAVKHNR